MKKNLGQGLEAMGAPQTESNNLGGLLSTFQSEEAKELVLERQNHRGKGRPKKGNEIGSALSDYTRACAVVNKTQWAKLQTIAKMEGVSIKTLLEAVFALSIKNYEDKKGEIKVNITGENLDSLLS